MLKILNVPNKALNKKVKSVKKVDSRVRRLIHEMEKVLVAQDDPPGVGLAAPQVGFPLRLFIIKPTPGAKTEVFINPKILNIGGSEDANFLRSSIKNKQKITHQATHKPPKNSKLEGCLSIPRFWAPINRQESIILSYLNQDGKEKTATFSGFKSIIIQHEIDHLNGVLFTQRAIEQSSQIYEEDAAGKLEKVTY